jgi:hypothetical protein
MPRGKLPASAFLAGTSGAADDRGGASVDDSGVGEAVTSWIATEVGSATDVAGVDDDEDSAGAGVDDETGAGSDSAVVDGATAVVETTEVVTLAIFSEVDVEYGRPVASM